MFRISKRQLEILDEEARNGYYKNLALLFQKELPVIVAGMSQETLLEKIAHLHGRASSIGIKGKRDVAMFVCISLLIGVDLTMVPEMRLAFESTSGRHGELLNALLQGLSARLSDKEANKE